MAKVVARIVEWSADQQQQQQHQHQQREQQMEQVRDHQEGVAYTAMCMQEKGPWEGMADFEGQGDMPALASTGDFMD